MWATVLVMSGRSGSLVDLVTAESLRQPPAGPLNNAGHAKTHVLEMHGNQAMLPM